MSKTRPTTRDSKGEEARNEGAARATAGSPELQSHLQPDSGCLTATRFSLRYLPTTSSFFSSYLQVKKLGN